METDVKTLKDKGFAIERTVSMHEASMNDLMKEVAKLRKRNSNENTGPTKEMINKMLEEAVLKIKKEFEGVFKEISENLTRKSGFEDLWKSEGFFLRKI